MNEPSEPVGFDWWFSEYGHALGIGRANAIQVYESAVQAWLCKKKAIRAATDQKWLDEWHKEHSAPITKGPKII